MRPAEPLASPARARRPADRLGVVRRLWARENHAIENADRTWIRGLLHGVMSPALRELRAWLDWLAAHDWRLRTRWRAEVTAGYGRTFTETSRGGFVTAVRL